MRAIEGKKGLLCNELTEIHAGRTKSVARISPIAFTLALLSASSHSLSRLPTVQPAGVRMYVSLNQGFWSTDLPFVVHFSQSRAVTTAVSPHTRTVCDSSSLRS